MTDSMSSRRTPNASFPRRVLSHTAGRFVSVSFLRFFAASLFGLTLDVCIAWLLKTACGLPLVAAAATSLVTVAFVMYFVHEFWTFSDGRRRLSAARMAGTVVSALLAIGIRSIFLYTTSRVLGFGERWALLQLLAAAGLSFMANYLLVQRILGRNPARFEQGRGGEAVVTTPSRISP